MKQIYHKIFFLIMLMNVCSLSAETTVEVRASAFFPSSKLFRSIYGNVNGSYGIEASTNLLDFFRCDCLSCMDEIDGFTNFDWFSRKGNSICVGDPTKVTIANFSFGIKIPYRICNCLAAYAGIGPSFSKIRVEDKSRCRHDIESKLVVGGIIKAGVYYYFSECIFVDIFADYLYQPVHFHHRNHVDIGGFKTGIGIGTTF